MSEENRPPTPPQRDDTIQETESNKEITRMQRPNLNILLKSVKETRENQNEKEEMLNRGIVLRSKDIINDIVKDICEYADYEYETRAIGEVDQVGCSIETLESYTAAYKIVQNQRTVEEIINSKVDIVYLVKSMRSKDNIMTRKKEKDDSKSKLVHPYIVADQEKQEEGITEEMVQEEMSVRESMFHDEKVTPLTVTIDDLSDEDSTSSSSTEEDEVDKKTKWTKQESVEIFKHKKKKQEYRICDSDMANEEAKKTEILMSECKKEGIISFVEEHMKKKYVEFELTIETYKATKEKISHKKMTGLGYGLLKLITINDPDAFVNRINKSDINEILKIVMVKDTTAKVSKNDQTVIEQSPIKTVVYKQKHLQVETKEGPGNKVIVTKVGPKEQGQVSVEATKVIVRTIKTDIPNFIEKLLKENKMVIFDKENCNRALKLSDKKISALSKMLASYGIATIYTTTSAEELIDNVTMAAVIEGNMHDDIAIQSIAAANGAVIVTQDRFSEFKNNFSLCTVHKTFQHRNNEVCHQHETNECKYKNMYSYAKFRMEISDVEMIGERITSLRVSDPLMIKCGDKSKIIRKTVKIVKDYLKGELSNITYSVPNLIRGTDIPSKTITATRGAQIDSFTLLSLKTGGEIKTVYDSDENVAIMKLMNSISSEDMEKLQDSISERLTIRGNKFVIVDEQGFEGNTREMQPLVEGLGADQINAVVAKKYLKVSGTNTRSDARSIKKLNINHSGINLEISDIILTQKLIDNKLIVISNYSGVYIIKIDQAFCDCLMRGWTSLICKNDKQSNTLMMKLPLDNSTREQLSSIMVSRDDSTESNVEHYTATIDDRNLPASIQRVVYNTSRNMPSTNIYSSSPNMDMVSTLSVKWTVRGEDNNITNKIIKTGDIKMRGKINQIEASTIMQSINSKLAEETGDPTDIYINIALVQWEAAEKITSRFISTVDQKLILEEMSPWINLMMFDTIADLYKTFNDLICGHKQLILPTLVRGVKLSGLTIDNRRVKDQEILINMTWRLPTCWVQAHLIIYSGTRNAQLVALVNVSPPALHNFVNARLGLDLEISNEYNTAMIERVEAETMELIFCAGEINYDYFNQYNTFMGVYYDALCMIGLDPLEIFIQNLVSIENQLGAQAALQVLNTNKSVAISDYYTVPNAVEAIAIGATYNPIKRDTEKGLIWVSREIHTSIDKLVKLYKFTTMKDMKNYMTAVIWLTVMAGKSNVEKHLRICYGVKLSFPCKIIDLHDIFVKLSKMQRCKCKLPTKIEDVEREKLVIRSDQMGITIEQSSHISVMEESKNYKTTYSTIPRNKTIIKDSVPTSGKVIWVIISTGSNYKNTRTGNIRKIFDRFHTDVQIVRIKDENKHSLKQLFEKINAEISKTRGKVLLTGYDQLGPNIKNRAKNEAATLKIKSFGQLHVPDNLLYKTMLSLTTITGEKESEELMSGRNEDEAHTEPVMGSKKEGRLSSTVAQTLAWVLGGALLLVFVLTLAVPLLVGLVFWPSAVVLQLCKGFMIPAKFPWQTAVMPVWVGLLANTATCVYLLAVAYATYRYFTQ